MPEILSLGDKLEKGRVTHLVNEENSISFLGERVHPDITPIPMILGENQIVQNRWFLARFILSHSKMISPFISH
jgi:hypothetical protein